jgi:hypothetical protein
MSKAGSCNLLYCASGFKILLVRLSDRRNDRDGDQWIPDHQLDYSKFKSNQFAWNQSDEWRLVWIGSSRGAYQFWLPQSGSGMTEDVQWILDQLDYSYFTSNRFPQSGPGIRRCKKQGGKLAKLFFHLPHPRACLRSAPLLIFLLFHCSSYLSDAAVYFSWFLPTFWCVVWRVLPYFSGHRCQLDVEEELVMVPARSTFQFLSILPDCWKQSEKTFATFPASVFLGVGYMACVGPVVACRG